ncbi:MAG: hypothetical protein WBA39_23175 [Rivularia sp. (in: cyanobacteria)]
MFNISIQNLISEGFEDSFIEPLSDREAQNINGGSLVFLDDDNRIIGWTETILPALPGTDGKPKVLSPVPPGTKPGDLYPYPINPLR